MAPRDFDVEGLAKYLHLTPAQIVKMAERDKLPGRKIVGQWRFSEAEIHHWLEQHIGATDSDGELARMEGELRKRDTSDADVCIADLLLVEAIAVPLNARTRQSVITRMVDLAACTTWVWDPEKMAAAVRAREDLLSTAMDNGVALMHPRRPQPNILAQPLLALGRTNRGIPFGEARGGLTDLFFLICSTDDAVHLRTLARLCRMIGDPVFLDALRNAEDAAGTHQIIQVYEQSHY